MHVVDSTHSHDPATHPVSPAPEQQDQALAHRALSGLAHVLRPRPATWMLAVSMNVMHVMLVFIMLWLSLALQQPGEVFLSTAFSGFKRYGTESQWAYWLLVAAGIGGVGLVAGRRWVQLLTTAMLATAHGSVALCFYQSNPPGGGIGTGTGTYTIIAAMGYSLFILRMIRVAA